MNANATGQSEHRILSELILYRFAVMRARYLCALHVALSTMSMTQTSMYPHTGLIEQGA
jgi:hypothetical protein